MGFSVSTKNINLTHYLPDMGLLTASETPATSLGEKWPFQNVTKYVPVEFIL